MKNGLKLHHKRRFGEAIGAHPDDTTSHIKMLFTHLNNSPKNDVVIVTEDFEFYKDKFKSVTGRELKSKPMGSFNYKVTLQDR